MLDGYGCWSIFDSIDLYKLSTEKVIKRLRKSSRSKSHETISPVVRKESSYILESVTPQVYVLKMDIIDVGKR